MPPITDPAILAQIEAQQKQKGITLAGPAMVAPAPPPPDPYYKPATPSVPRMSLPPRAQQAASMEEARLRLSQGSDIRSANQEAARIELARNADHRAQAEFDEKYTIPKPPGDLQKTGEDYLKTIDPNLALQVKAMAEGRRPFPTGAALRNPQAQMLVAAATQFDPSLDATDVTTRVKTRSAFTSGKERQKITSLNTVLGHLDSLAKAAADLDNTGSPMINAPLNFVKSNALGDPGVKTFRLTANAVADELERAFRQSGGNVTEIEAWKEQLSAASSPDQFNHVIRTAVDLLQSRLDALGSAYEAGMKRSVDPVSFLNPKAQEIYQRVNTSEPLAAYMNKEEPAVPAEDKHISTTEKAIEVPPGYQEAHAAYLKHHGTLTVDGYMKLRQDLDKQFLPENESSHLDMKSVKDFVDQYNKGHGSTKIPAINVPLHGLEKVKAEVGASGPGVLATSAADAATFGTVGLLAGQDFRDMQHLAAKEHPVWDTVGEVAGSLSGMSALEKGGLKVLEKAGVDITKLTPTARKKLLKEVVVNSGYGGIRGFNGADDGEGIKGALKGAGSGTVGAAVGAGVTQGVTPLLSEGTSKALAKLSGVKTTTLQKLGFGQIESAFSGVPLAHGARTKAMNSFNLDLGKRTLAFIGEKLPKHIAPGTDMNAYVNQQLSNAYNTIRPQIVGSADKQFASNLAAVKLGANTAEKKVMFTEINDALKKFTDPKTGAYTGQGYKEASERLRYLAKTWATQADAQGNVAAGDMARAAEQARKQMQLLIQRQTPEVGLRLKSIERGWAHSVRVEDATNRALANNEGVVSPSQYLTSIKKLDTSSRKGATARGKGLDQSYGEAAATILGPGAVPKLSPKETSLILSAVGGSTFISPGIPAILGAISTGLYGPGAKQVVQKILTGTRPSWADNQLLRRAISDATRHKMTGN